MTQEQALSILKTGVNVFLTGEPGAGKTHTINEYTAYLHRHGIDYAVTASTGIAATHIGGVTIHSWSGVGIRETLDRATLTKIASTQYIVKRVYKAKVLIIEEVSMLLPETLTMVDSICREIRQIQKPFGGLQVIFAGDFFQLPPVQNEPNPQEGLLAEETPRFAYESPAWKEAKPVICYLTEQHRQDDQDFLTILTSIRKNEFDATHLAHLEARKVSYDAVPDSVPKLFPHNAAVDHINDTILAKLQSEQKIFSVSSQGPDALVSMLKKGCLSPELLYLKIGAAVMFTKNNAADGFANGTIGVVEKFAKETDFPMVRLQNGRLLEVEPMDWTIEEGSKTIARITQIPLRLAWAITVHKSQGMSMDSAVIDLSNVFEYGQGYVALSRVRRLAGLFIVGWNERAFEVHPEILAEDKNFRVSSAKIQRYLEQFSQEELQRKHSLFIRASGGKTKKIRKLDKDTYNQTLLLWNEGKNTTEIAKMRELTNQTILGHIEHLYMEGKIKKSELSRLLTPSLNAALPKIHAAFHELKTQNLVPVAAKLHNLYTYNQLRIARLMLPDSH